MILWSFVEPILTTFVHRKHYSFFFEAISGLKVNMAKLTLVLVGNVDNMVEFAGILWCGTSSLPLKYLGLPIGTHFKAKSSWDGIVEKINRRLVSWKIMNLFKGGRITLIKSTFSNLPMYFLSIFPIPAIMVDRKIWPYEYMINFYH